MEEIVVFSMKKGLILTIFSSAAETHKQFLKQK